MSNRSDRSTKQGSKQNGQPKRLSILFGYGLIGIGLLLLVGIIPARLSLFDTDHQLANLAGMGLGILGVLALYLGVWFLVARTWVHHLLFLVGPASLIGLISTCVEFVGFTGETLPVFRTKIWKNAAGKNLPSSMDVSHDLGEHSVDSSVSFASLQFLGNDRNGIISAPTFSVGWAERAPEIAWKSAIGAGWSGFAIANGLAITLEQVDGTECVTAYRLSSGEREWQTPFPGKHFQAFGGLGPRSTPTIVSDHVYIQTALGILACLHLENGTTLWQQDLLELAGIDQTISEQSIAWGRSGSPLIVDEQVIVPFGGRSGSPQLKTLIAFHRKNGSVLWEGGDSQIAYASPMLLTLAGIPQIVSVNEDCATGHNPTNGDELWRTPWPSKSNADACASQPVLIGERRILLGKGYALGSKVIELNFSGDQSNPYDANAWTVEEIWSNTRILKTKFTSAIAYGDALYGLSDGILECVDPSDGKRIWRGNRYGQGQAIIVNGYLVISTEDGRIALVKADRESGGSEIAVIPVLEGITWNVPTIAGPYLIVRNGEQVACLKSEKVADELGAP